MQDNATQPLLPRIGLSQGDINGIAYEVMLKTFSDSRMFETLIPVLYGQSKAFSYYKKNLGLESPNYTLTRDALQAAEKKFNVINIIENEVKIESGAPTETSAELSVLSMKKALEDLHKGVTEALVLAPDSRMVARINQDYLFSFHKDMDTVRVMVNDKLRIALATDDLPLAEAIGQIEIRYLVSKLTVFSQALKTDFGLNAPKIAVLGLNPHSGTLVGDDEKVAKAVGDAQKKGIFAFGPFSTSQLFASNLWKKYDAVMAMYYEQGVFPLRQMALDGCAYYWAGLPEVCTAPMHGAAFELVNGNKAEPDAYRKAVFLAMDIANQRKEK